MLARTPAAWARTRRSTELDDEALAAIGETVVAPVLREMARRGTPFRGALFCGLMLTTDGPRVLEFNVRLGDPETQAIVPRVDAPLAQLMLECAQGRLSATGVLPAPHDAAVARRSSPRTDIRIRRGAAT